MGRKPGNGTWSEQHVQLTGQTRSYLRYRPAGGLTLIRVENGGHAWPGGRQYLPEMVVGHATREFSAAEVIFRWLLAE